MRAQVAYKGLAQMDLAAMNLLHEYLTQFSTDWIEGREARPWLFMLAELALLVISIRILRPQFRHHARLKEAEYAHPAPIKMFFRHGSKTAFVFMLVLPLVLRANSITWNALSPSWTLKFFVISIATALAWSFSLYRVNYYYGQLHLAERALILLFLLFLFTHPLFAAPLLIMLFVQRHQFHYPLGTQFGMTDKIPLFEILTLFVGWILVRALGIPVMPESFAIFAFSIPAASYFYSGLQKLRIRWIETNNLSNLFAAAYDNGWLGFLDARGFTRFARIFDNSNFSLKIYTLVVELGIVFALADDALVVALLGGVALLHVGIFVASGICFWEWIILDLTLIPFLIDSLGSLSGSAPGSALIFSGVIILLAPALFTVKYLAWHDSPLSGVYRFEGILQNGSIVEIPPGRFTPYDLPFAQNRFHYLNPDKVLVNVYGKAGSPTIMEGLQSVTNSETLENLRRELGKRQTDHKRRARFECLVRRLLTRRNTFPQPWRCFEVLSPPQHIRTAPVTESPWNGRAPLVRVRVSYTETLFFDGRRTKLSERNILEIDLMTSDITSHLSMPT